MTSIRAETDAAMGWRADARDADAGARIAAMSTERETAPSAAEQTAGADATRPAHDPVKSPPLNERAPQPDTTTKVIASGAEFRSRLHWFIGAADVRSQDPGSLTYEPYFGLREKPFSLSSDPRFFFSHSSHGAAFDTLAAGIRRREGILVLTGEVGTGKTTLCRAVLQSLDQKTFAAFVPDPFLSREDLLKTLLVDFGVVSVDEIRSGRLRGASRTDLSYPLYDFLTSLQPLKAFAVVMIDEAQNLTAELLEEIRILSDLDNGQKLLEVVLVGQPELQSRLATPEMRQLSQRVSIRCELSPLVRGDIARYVSHRLTVSGNDGRVQFTNAAIEFVWAASHGIPRVINLVCDRALLCAARSRTMRVEGQHVVGAVDDLGLPVPATFDQARARESLPQEFPEAPAEPEAQPEPIPSEAFADAPDEPPGDPFTSFLRKSDQAAAEPAKREEANQPPHASRSAHGLGADFSMTVISSRVAETREIALPIAGARMFAFNADSAAARQRRRRTLTPAGACLALIAAVVGYWYSMAPVSRRPQSVAIEQPARTPEVVDPSPASQARLNAPAAPVGSSDHVVSSARNSERAGTQEPALGQAAAGFALQMATFQSDARAVQAVQEFRDAGYQAYRVERSLRDGTRAYAVFLGPYAQRAAAERDRERARQIPGYGTGLVVQMNPAPSLQ
jgi:type II secretory pathway predicted ATPase ExeA/cell division septation protein DedD